MKNILSAVVVLGILLSGCTAKKADKVVDKTPVVAVDAGADTSVTQTPTVVGPVQTPAQQASPAQSVEQK